MSSVSIETARVKALERFIDVLQTNLSAEITTLKTTLDASGNLTIDAPASTDYYVARDESEALALDYPNNHIVVYFSPSREIVQPRQGSAAARREVVRNTIGVLFCYRVQAGDNEFSTSWKSNLETKERNLYAREIVGGAIVRTIYKYATNSTDVLRVDLIDDDPQFVEDSKPQTTFVRSLWRVAQKVQIPHAV